MKKKFNYNTFLVLENAYADSQAFFDLKNELNKWIEIINGEIQANALDSNFNGERICDLLEQHKTVHEQIERRTNEYNTLYQKGKVLEDHAPSNERRKLATVVEDLRKTWEEMNQNDLKKYINKY